MSDTVYLKTRHELFTVTFFMWLATVAKSVDPRCSLLPRTFFFFSSATKIPTMTDAGADGLFLTIHQANEGKTKASAHIRKMRL